MGGGLTVGTGAHHGGAERVQALEGGACTRPCAVASVGTLVSVGHIAKEGVQAMAYRYGGIVTVATQGGAHFKDSTAGGIGGMSIAQRTGMSGEQLAEFVTVPEDIRT